LASFLFGRPYYYVYLYFSTSKVTSFFHTANLRYGKNIKIVRAQHKNYINKTWTPSSFSADPKIRENRNKNLQENSAEKIEKMSSKKFEEKIVSF
jgi:hypothetical protein